MDNLKGEVPKDFSQNLMEMLLCHKLNLMFLKFMELIFTILPHLFSYGISYCIPETVKLFVLSAPAEYYVIKL